MTSDREPLELPDEIVREAVPDDDIVLAYVTRGVMARYVEGVAAKNAGFREELMACIDGLEEAGETISAAARDWRSPSAAVVSLHEVRAAGAAPRTKKRRSPFFYWAPIALAAAFVLVAGGYHHQQAKDEQARLQRADKEREIAELNARVDKLHEDLRRQQEAIATAQSELAMAKTDAERASAQAKLAAAQEQQRATMSSVQAAKASAAGRPATSRAKAACTCQPGDPLCSCL